MSKIDKPLEPGLHFGAAIAGALFTGLFSCATYSSYSSQHPTAFKVSFIVGAVFSLLVQAGLYVAEDINSKELKLLPLAFFGFLVPAFGTYQLTVRKIWTYIAPETWIHPVSPRGVTCLSATALGYAATNALFEGYHYYRSRQSAQ